VTSHGTLARAVSEDSVNDVIIMFSVALLVYEVDLNKSNIDDLHIDKLIN
jgi:hypothetical protein